MVFIPRHISQGIHFEHQRPYSLGLANQQVYGHGKDGHGDINVDYLNDKLGGVVKDESFWHTQWAKNAPKPEPLQPAQIEDLQAPRQASLVPQILTIVGIALVAAVLAYQRPDLFANLFKLFIGYEVFSLLVGAALVLLILIVFLLGAHKGNVAY